MNNPKSRKNLKRNSGEEGRENNYFVSNIGQFFITGQ